MADGNRDWATGLGRTVRGFWILLRILVFVAGFVLVVRGLWFFNAGVGYIGGGLLLLFFFAPRPNRGQ